jgi:hypothetical protein
MLKIGKLYILKKNCAQKSFGFYKSLYPTYENDIDNYVGRFNTEELQNQPFLLLETEKYRYPWIKVLIDNKIGWVGIDSDELDEFKG